MDTLSLLVSMANVTAHSDVLVVDMIGGILIGAVAERMGGICYLLLRFEPSTLLYKIYLLKLLYTVGTSFIGDVITYFHFPNSLSLDLLSFPSSVHLLLFSFSVICFYFLSLLLFFSILVGLPFYIT